MESKGLILNIIPIFALPHQAPDFFTYFSNSLIKPGALVEIELKKKKVLGYVSKTYQPAKYRHYLKKSHLSLKPVIRIINQTAPILKYQHILASWMKNYYGISLGHAYNFVLPFINYLCKLKINLSYSPGNKYELRWLKDFNQLASYKSQKLLFIVPDETLINDYQEKLNNINETKVFTSKLSPSKRLSTLNQILSDKSWVLGTKNILFLPWSQLSAIVLLDESSDFYKEKFRPPFPDYRTIARKLANLLKIPLIVFDDLPSFHFFKLSNKRVITYPINFEIANSLDEVKNQILNSNRIIYFVPQKLTSYRVICNHCWSYLKCERDEEFLWLKSSNLICPICNRIFNFEKCPYCQNNKQVDWFLKYLGGEGIIKYLENLKRKAILIKNEKDLMKANEYQDIVGSYLLWQKNWQFKFDYFIFVNFDQFFYTRDVFLREKFLRIIKHLSSFSQKTILITSIKSPIFEHIKSGNIWNILYQERKLEKLPPFYRLVKIVFSLTDLKNLQERVLIAKNKINLKKSPKDIIIGPIFAYPEKHKRKFFLQLLLKLKSENLLKLVEDIEFTNLYSEAENFM